MAKRALIVGINDYKKVSDLRGCINDVTNIRNVLKTYYGFTNRDIRVLTDARATTENIEFRLKKLVSLTKPGDMLIFHFSGHGSQIRDREGDELKDQMDEIICPHDMDWDGKFITDDKLSDIFKELANGSHLEVILDCCHSGDGLRDIGLLPPPELRTDDMSINRYLPPPIDIMSRHEGEENELKATRGFQSETRSTSKFILWAGCRSEQTSADAKIGGYYNGAFSYYFCKHIRETGGQISRQELIKRIRNSLRHNNYSQVPQLEVGSSINDIKAFEN